MRSQRILFTLDEAAIQRSEETRKSLERAGLKNLASLNRGGVWSNDVETAPASALESVSDSLSTEMAADWNGDDLELLRRLPGVRSVELGGWKETQ